MIRKFAVLVHRRVSEKEQKKFSLVFSHLIFAKTEAGH